MTHKPTQLYSIPRDFAGPRYADSLDGPARHIVIGAMPTARALVLRNQSLRLFSLRASVTIAVFTALYFAWQFLGRPGL